MWFKIILVTMGGTCIVQNNTLKYNSYVYCYVNSRIKIQKEPIQGYKAEFSDKDISYKKRTIQHDCIPNAF